MLQMLGLSKSTWAAGQLGSWAYDWNIEAMEAGQVQH